MSKFLLFLMLSFVPLTGQCKPHLRIYTYGSFASPYGPGPALKTAFEAECNCTVEFSASDTSLMLAHRLLREQNRARADAVIGIDALSLEALSSLFPQPLTPYSFTALSLIYDSHAITHPPKNLEELAQSNHSIILQDPRTSTTGLNFITWLDHLDPTLKNFEKLAPHILTYTKGWSQSYALFLRGEADFVLSYTTSPLYHHFIEKEPRYRALEFEEGHICSHEYVGIPATSSNPQLAEHFIAFILSPKGQKIIAEKAWVYPLHSTPQEWGSSPVYMVPKTLIHLEDIDLNASTLIHKWKEAYR